MKLALALVLLPAIAWAQPHRDTGFLGNQNERPLLEIDDCQPTTMVADDRLRAGAEHYQRGETLYLQGDYPAAVKEFIDAYCLKPDFYTILKDIGQAYERDLDYEKAIAYLERFVLAVPPEAKKAPGCSPDPQVDKDNVIARIGILTRLRAQVLVQTDPKDASVVISNDAGTRATGRSGQNIDVFGGHYAMLIEKPGFESQTQPLDARIGKPLTVFVRLEPVKGRLALLASPPDARLYLDNNYVGTGSFEDRRIKAGTYDVSAEAAGYETSSQRIVVLPEQESRISIEMEARVQTGRRQLVIASAIAGAASFGSITNAFAELGIGGVAGGSVAGGVVGFAGAYFLVPDDIPLGTSSLTITSTFIGYMLGAFGTALVSSNDGVITPLAGGSLLVSAATGYYIGKETHIKSGDAAVINSGVVWGSAMGALFATSFNADRRIGAALTLSGLGMGAVGGVLSARYFNISRSHAALIDLGGVLGLIGGLATEALAYPTKSGNSAAQDHLSNFAIAGLATGLIGAGILTRNYDAPIIPVTPSFGQAQTAHGSTPTLGFGGTF